MTVRVCAITGRIPRSLHHLSIIMPNLPFSVFACYELNLDLARGYIISLIKLAQLVNICCDR